jgi:hypothetical protein
MAVERVPGNSSLVDVLDRILEKGIVVDGWARISLDGIDVLSENARMVVVSNETHLTYKSSVADLDLAPQALPNKSREDRAKRNASGKTAKLRR